jgi:hypothetical protein
MNEKDDGPASNGLRRLAWLFGVITVAVLVRVVALSEDGVVQPEVFIWVLLGSMAAVSSAACTVLVAVKGLAKQLARSDEHEEAHP